MQNTIEKYFNSLKVLKSAQKDMQNVYYLNKLYMCYNRNTAINFLSSIYIQYEKEFNKIGNLLTAKKIIVDKKASPIEAYNKYQKTDNDIKEELLYAIDCLIIVFAVKQKLVKSIDYAILELKEN